MTQEQAEPEALPDVDDAHDSVGSSFAQLYADGRAYAQAEVERQKLRAGIFAGGVRDAAILGTLALTLFFAGLVALLVGLVIALAPRLGPVWAACAIFGGALLVVIMLGLLIRARIVRMNRDMRS
ncbi:MAG: phage holin family protein [Sphingobium sp.]